MKACNTKTIFLFIAIISFTACCTAQLNDSFKNKINSGYKLESITTNKIHSANLDSILKKNKYLNLTTTPISFATKEKNKNDKDFLFYLLGTFILILAIFKAFYSRYFNNIFRVFFNTSLRQNQLTDLLLQAKLPSLIFNIFFVMSAGLYGWLLLNHYHLLKENNYLFIVLSILFIAAIYFGKYISLKFIGWIAGIKVSTDQYIFVIFLINKITGIILIPFIILLGFAPAAWLNPIIISSFLVLGILFLLRYLRSFGLLQGQLKIIPFHFLVYIVGMEILPILIIYKMIFRILV
ncbi:MAG: DUF4271 domain-containing protein [Bacteroidota bacterium]|nr:DUF4271 domain-containing protein [Bacteroidota bacterium]